MNKFIFGWVKIGKNKRKATTLLDKRSNDKR